MTKTRLPRSLAAPRKALLRGWLKSLKTCHAVTKPALLHGSNF
ncbi:MULTISPECIES: hypothetical protein [unclassified Rickettsia]